MKKLILLLMGLTILVSGCAAAGPAKGKVKQSRMELYSAQDGTLLAVVDDQEQIMDLWNPEEWEACDRLPEDLTPEYQILVSQEKTLLYGQDPEEEREYETVAVLTTFQDSDYVQESIPENFALPGGTLTFFYTMPDKAVNVLDSLTETA